MGLAAGWNQLAAATPTDVLIYYANESSPTGPDAENYRTIIAWLDSSELAKAQAIAGGLKNEAALFGGAVAEERQALESQAPHCQPPLPVLIFTNRLAQQGMFRLYRPGRDEEFTTSSIQRLTNENYIVESNPLSQGEMLKRALAAAAEHFDPRQYRFILVTKSHGGTNLALTVRLARRHEEITREQLLAGLRDGTSAVAAAEIGTSKEEFFAILRRAGEQQGMEFSLVFIEACQGTFEQPLAQQLPPNVRLLYASGNRYLQYQSLDYPRLLDRLDAQHSLSKILDEELTPRYLALYRAPEAPPTAWRWLWCLPLAAWLVWMFVQWRHSRARDQRTTHAT